MKQALLLLLVLGITFPSLSNSKSSTRVKSSSIKNTIKVKLRSTKPAKKSACHICCTISSYNPANGQYIGMTACAGWLLTSCETARERACEKVTANLVDMLNDM